MKRLLSFFVLLFAQQTFFGQTISDALRYSYLEPGGSARSLGAGNAFGALGADYSVLSANPAGLAMYRTDELVFTPALRFANTTSTLRGTGNTPLDDDKSNFNFNNFGLIFNTEPTGGHWKTFNVGIGLNKLANFNNSIYYQGQSAGSLMNGWFQNARNTLGDYGNGDPENLDPFTTRLAYDANAIYLQDSLLSYDFLGNETASVARNQALVSSGSVNEMVISFAGNYEEKLMVGATIGVPFVNYKLDGSYTETDPSDNVPYFDKLNYTEFLRTNGVGVNLKMGVIYRASQMLRIGAAFHTPTLMGLTDNFENSFQYDYTDGSGSHAGDLIQSPNGTSDYKLRTPWRASLSGAVLVKKYGFLSADVEWVDYSANRFNLTANVASAENQQYERDLNNAISRAYKQAMNIRVGGEAAIGPIRLRAGANLLGKASQNADGFNMAYTGGIGVRASSFYVDLGLRYASGDGTVAAYTDPAVDAANQPVVDTKFTKTDVLLTVGFKF